MTIEIIKEGRCFQFISDEELKADEIRCHLCKDELSVVYSYIIKKLKEAGLLSKDYNPTCCFCDIAEKTLKFHNCPICDDKLFILYKRRGIYNYLIKCRCCYYEKTLLVII